MTTIRERDTSTKTQRRIEVGRKGNRVRIGVWFNEKGIGFAGSHDVWVDQRSVPELIAALALTLAPDNSSAVDAAGGE